MRGGLPGETVRVTRTGTSRGGRIVFADVTQVLEASPDRVEPPPCQWAGRCGGCDLLHVAPTAQESWKARVIADQLARIGGIRELGGVPIAEAVVVESVPVDAQPPGLGWRTRLTLDVDEAGRGCFHVRRGELLAVGACPVVVPALQEAFSFEWPAAVRGRRLPVALHTPPRGEGVDVGDGIGGGVAEEQIPTVDLPGDVPVPPGWRRAATVRREAFGRSWRVATDGFWQAHVRAPEVLGAAVLQAVTPSPGASVVELYSGVGLFAGVLGDAVGPAGRVDAVEGDARAHRLARRNLHDLPQVHLHGADVRGWVGPPAGRAALSDADAVVLDPPRSGAGRVIVEALAGSGADVICYVACDPAPLARDLRTFLAAGWRLASLRAFDLFGMSAHVETVATLRRGR